MGKGAAERRWGRGVKMGRGVTQSMDAEAVNYTRIKGYCILQQ